MTKEHIIAVLAFLIVLAGFGAVWEFYFRGQVEAFNDDLDHLDDLDAQLTKLEETFSGVKPQVVVQAWRGEVEPWAEAQRVRQSFFTMGEAFEYKPVPEGEFPKFHYEKQFNEMFTALQREAYSMTPPRRIPNTTFGTPLPQEAMQRNLAKADVEANLKRISFGCSIVRMMLDADVYTLDDVQIWPTRVAHGELLDMLTVGLRFTTTAQNLVRFLDSLRTSDRYFSVDGISVQNRRLTSPWDPLLDVQLLLTQARIHVVRVKNEDGEEVDVPSELSEDVLAPPPPRSATGITDEFFEGQTTPDFRRKWKRPSTSVRVIRWIRLKLWPF